MSVLKPQSLIEIKVGLTNLIDGNYGSYGTYDNYPPPPPAPTNYGSYGSYGAYKRATAAGALEKKDANAEAAPKDCEHSIECSPSPRAYF